MAALLEPDRALVCSPDIAQAPIAGSRDPSDHAADRRRSASLIRGDIYARKGRKKQRLVSFPSAAHIKEPCIRGTFGETNW